jgi:hypothetical protein
MEEPVHRVLSLTTTAFTLATALLAAPAAGQSSDKIPSISKRMYASGSAQLTVTGSFTVNATVELNQGSYSSGDYTWLQYGASGAEEANVLVTLGEDGYGIGPGLGKNGAIAEGDLCKGKTEVTASLVSGSYTCKGMTSYNSSTRKMGTVDITVRFTAVTKVE